MFAAFGAQLEIVGTGLRNCPLPAADVLHGPELETASTGLRSRGGLRGRGGYPGEARDLEAFRAAGWRFVEDPAVDWSEVQEPYERLPLDAGLLARRPGGGLIVLRNRVIVKLKEGVDAGERLGRYAGYELLGFGRALYVVDLGVVGQDLQGSIKNQLEELQHSAEVEFAEPSVLFRVHRPLPTGPARWRSYPGALPRSMAVRESLHDQWHWGKICLADAWKLGGDQGKNCRVGVVDFGFHPDDPQLVPNVAWTGCVTAEGQCLENVPMPRDWHGTFCAGLIGAIQDDRRVYGAAPQCSLALVALPEHHLLAPEVLGEALKFCAERGGADVINCSIGTSESSMMLSNTLREAIDDVHRSGRAGGRGCLIVWASFNADTKFCEGAVEDYAPLLCVAASDSADRRANSGWGSGLDLLAPGIRVPGLFCSVNGSSVSAESGASFAAPCVTGVAALVLAARPELSACELADLICQSCDRVGPGEHPNPSVGWGRLNAEAALRRALAIPQAQ
jgi:subtilisin family serine protease